MITINNCYQDFKYMFVKLKKFDLLIIMYNWLNYLLIKFYKIIETLNLKLKVLA